MHFEQNPSWPVPCRLTLVADYNPSICIQKAEPSLSSSLMRWEKFIVLDLMIRYP